MASYEPCAESRFYLRMYNLLLITVLGCRVFFTTELFLWCRFYVNFWYGFHHRFYSFMCSGKIN